MKLSNAFRFSHYLILTLCLPLTVATVQAAEPDLQDTLRKLESLLEQQQQELQAQRKELAEQRELIRQLQESQSTGNVQAGTVPGQNDPVVGVSTQAESGEDQVVSAKQQDSAEIQLASGETVEADVATDSSDNSAQQQALAELEKREKDVSLGIEPTRSTIQEDPSNTTYDASFPGAWHLPGTTAAMKIGGYVNLALINSFDPMLISDRFIVGSIPPEGEDIPGARAGTDVTANQTRVNFEVREQTRQGPLRAFVEADFEGEGDTFRLRHAFGQFRWILAGKSWSTLMDIDSRPEEVDFEGINGEILSRQAQLRIFPTFGKAMSFKLSVEDPRTDIANGTGAKGRGDLVLSVDRLPLGQLGSWNSRVAVILRDLRGDPVDADAGVDSSKSATGWGITTSGRKSIGYWDEQDYLLWQVTYGKGIGRYLNDLNTVGGGDAVFDPMGNLQALPVFAGYVSYKHAWPKTFWFLKNWSGDLHSSFTFSWVNIDNYKFQDAKDYKSTLRASANLIYLPTTNVRFGAELLWGSRENKDGSKGTATQVQISARYNF